MENTEEPCIICFEENKEKILFDCNHSICLVCYSKLLEKDNATCPVCRQKIDNLVKAISTYIPIPNEPEHNSNHRSSIGIRGVLCFLGVIGSVIIIIIVTARYSS